MTKRRRSRTNPNTKYLAILVGLFVLFSVYNVNQGDSRTDSMRVGDVSDIVYDGTESNFEVVLEEWDGIATADEEHIVSLRVSNLDTVTSMMYVQCSFLEDEEGFDDVCGNSDSGTQVYQIDLAPYGESGENRLQNFYIFNPHSPGSYRVYCMAFEQCLIDGDTMASDSSFQRITVNAPEYDNGGTNTTEEDGDELVTCSVDADCGTWYNNQECINGVCRDVETKIMHTDSEIANWARDYKIMLLFFGAALILFGVFAIYKEPRY